MQTCYAYDYKPICLRHSTEGIILIYAHYVTLIWSCIRVLSIHGYDTFISPMRDAPTYNQYLALREISRSRSQNGGALCPGEALKCEKMGVATFCDVILAIIFPPLGVLFKYGCAVSCFKPYILCISGFVLCIFRSWFYNSSRVAISS